MSDFSVTETKFGFVYGPVTIERTLSDDRYGVLITISGKRGAVEVRCTPGGRVTCETTRKLFKHEIEKFAGKP